MTDSPGMKLEKKTYHLKMTKHYGFKKWIRCNGYSKPSMSEGFSFFNTCAFGNLPCSQSHFARKQVATQIYTFGPENKDLISYLHTNQRTYLIMELGNVVFITTEEVTTDEAGRSHLPWAVLSFVVSAQVSRQPYSPVGSQSDLMSVLLPVSQVLDVSQAPPTPPPGPGCWGRGWHAGKQPRKMET